MEIDDFKQEKKAMESKILDAVEQAMRSFRASTGYSPDSISIDLARVTTHGEEYEHYVVAGVSSVVDI